MALDVLFYIDTQSEDGQTLYRWECKPYGATDFSPSGEPAWGADPGVGSDYKKFPADTIISVRHGDQSTREYDSAQYPIGMPTRAGYKIVVRMTGLLATGDTDHSSLADHLRDNAPPTASVTALTSAPDLELANYWVLKKGSKGDAIGAFVTEFEGVQRHTRRKTWTTVPGDDGGAGGAAYLTLEIDDIAQATLKRVPMTWVMEVVRDNAGQSATFCAWQRLWQATVAANTWTWGQVQAPQYNAFFEWKAGYVLEFVKWQQFYQYCQSICAIIYGFWTRDQKGLTNYETFKFQTTEHSTTPWGGGPIDLFTFYEPDYTPSYGRGAAVSADAVYMLAGVEAQTAAPGAGGGAFHVGGLLWQNVDGALSNRFDTLWEFLHKDCQMHLARGEYSYTSDGITLNFYGWQETGSTTDLTISDIIAIQDIEDGGFGIEYAEVARSFQGPVDAENLVSGNQELRDGGESWGADCFRRTVPSNGKAEDAYEDFRSPPHFTPRRGRVAHSWDLSVYDGVYLKKAATALGGSALLGYSDLFILAHHDLTVNESASASTLYSYTLDTLPINASSDFTADMRGVNVKAQFSAGIAYAHLTHLLSILGDATISRYTLRVYRSALDYDSFGNLARLTPIDGAAYTATPLLNISGDSTYDHMPGICHIVSVTPEDETASVVVRLLGVRTT